MSTPGRFLARHPRSMLVDLAETRGSTPREAGTFMLVSADALWGTIGGGQFEFIAIEHARAMLAGERREATLDVPLGPEIGQCCGGRTLLRFQPVDAAVAADIDRRLRTEEEAQPSVYLFGAGHVGKAIAAALSPLPLSVTVLETRLEELAGLPADVEVRHAAMPEAAIAELPSGSAVLIVTHDHALDFLIAREALARPDLAYIGMIGSATKRATFAHWLSREGGERSWLDRLVLPIGGDTVKDKRPAVIAALVAAELLVALHAFKSAHTLP
nr:xanthine dehydrogenase accessory protein XdhC [Rhizobium album]